MKNLVSLPFGNDRAPLYLKGGFVAVRQPNTSHPLDGCRARVRTGKLLYHQTCILTPSHQGRGDELSDSLSGEICSGLPSSDGFCSARQFLMSHSPFQAHDKSDTHRIKSRSTHPTSLLVTCHSSLVTCFLWFRSALHFFMIPKLFKAHDESDTLGGLKA